jgi:EF-hand domain
MAGGIGLAQTSGTPSGMRSAPPMMPGQQMPSQLQHPQRLPRFNFALFASMVRGMPALAPALSAVPMQVPAMPYGYPMSSGYSQGKRRGQDYDQQQSYPSQRLENRPVQSENRPVTKDLADQFIERMDADGAGKISSKEAKGVFLEFFDRFDLDHDGYLERDEIEAALRHYPILLTRYSGVPASGARAAGYVNDTDTAPRASQTPPPR